ncbi:MAG: hypothetical protein AMJ94_14070 [Deltaproteobacteria bacterium SM23_61]|nr:MAG: hypothetical protein AMJ94_14070 [Deltaproteobacteria bacterium SM23_61]
MGTSSSFQFRNEQFFARSRKSRDCAEVYRLYTAQTIPQIDAEIAEKCHFWIPVKREAEQLMWHGKWLSRMDA